MLSPFTFLLNNKKKIGVIVAILIMSVFTVNFVTTMIDSIYDTCEQTNVKPFENFSIVTCEKSQEYITKEKIDEIRSCSNVRKVYTVLIENISINTVFGTTSSYIYFINDQKIISELLLDLGLSIKDGRVPERGKYEIVLHDSVAKNKDVFIGDYVGDYQVVGIISGKTQVSIGTQNKQYEQISSYMDNNNLAISLLMLPQNGQIIEMNKEIKETIDESLQFYGWEDANKNINDEFSSIKIILLLVIIMLSLSLAISVAALTFSIYANRYEEFGILNAIGYQKKSIRALILKEISTVTCLGWLVGYGISILGLLMFNQFVYVKMGQSMSIITKNGMMYTIFIPIFVFIFTIVPVSIKLRKTDLISIIERR